MRVFLLRTLLFLLVFSPVMTQAKDFYWVGGTSSDLNNTANWSYSKGGRAVDHLPGAEDQIIFESASPLNLVLTNTLEVYSIKSLAPLNITSENRNALKVRHTLILAFDAHLQNSLIELTGAADASGYIETKNNAKLYGDLTINSAGSWKFLDGFNQAEGTVVLSNGKMVADNAFITINSFVTSGTNLKTIDLNRTTLYVIKKWDTKDDNTLQYTAVKSKLQFNNFAFDATYKNGHFLYSPSTITSVTCTAKGVSCGGVCDGYIIVNVVSSCATASYDIAYTSSQSLPNRTTNVNDTIKNLCKDDYTIGVTDDCDNSFDGCVVSVGGPNPMVANFNPSSPVVSCSGVCDGSLSLTILGGNGPTSGYTYSWSGGQTGKTPTTLCAGSNSVIVTDTKSCKDTFSVTVTSPAVLTATVNALNVSCSGICDGSATITGNVATGGTAPYTYSWLNSSNVLIGSSNTGISNLCVGSYSLKVVDSKGCTSTIPFTISVPNPIILSSTNTNASCFGYTDGSLSISISGGTSPYTVSSNPAATWTVTGSTASATSLGANIYTITVTDANTCTQSIDDTITEPAQIIVTPVATPSSYCNGGSTTLTASSATAGLTYSWSPATTPTTGTPVVANPTSTTDYTVTGTDVTGCFDTSIVTVTVNPLPIVSTNPATATATCLGTAVPVTASMNNTAVSYTWTTTASPTGLSAVTGTTVSINPISTTTYTITGTDNKGCQGSTTLTVTVNPLPTVTLTPSSSISCANSPVAFTAGGLTSGTYAWTVGAGTLSSATGTNVTVTPTASTIVTVVGTDGNGCSATKTASITVQALPTISISASSTLVCPGFPTTLTGSGAGVGGSYTWNPSAPSPVIGNPYTPSPFTTTIYTVRGADVNGCANTATITINVNPQPAATANNNGPKCSGSSVTLSGGGVTNYTWYSSPVPSASIGSAANINVTPAVTSTYTLVGSDALGCTDTVTTTVTVNPLPTIVASANPNPICTGSTTVLSGSGAGAGTYSWTSGGSSVGAGSPLTVTPPATSIYTLSGTDGNGCTSTDTILITLNPPVNVTPANPTICSGTSAVLSATGAVTYTWYDPSNTQIDTGSTITVSPTVTTVYTIVATDAVGCTGTAYDTVYVNPFLPITVSNDTSICIGSTATLTASSSGIGVTYTWTGSDMTPSSGISSSISVLPLVTGNYTYIVNAIDVNTCTNSDTVLVTVNGLPTVVGGPNQQMCFGDSAVITASGANTYSWYSPGNVFEGTGASLTVYPSVSTSYTVLGYNVFGCSDDAFVAVIVNALPTANAGTNDSVCLGNSTTLLATGGVSYSWSPAAGLNLTNISNPVASPTITTDYIVEVTDNKGCKNSDTVNVKVNTINVVASANDYQVCFGSGTTLFGLPAGAASYNWSPGTGVTTVTSQNPVISLSATTIYTLTVVDNNGCTDVDTVQVTVNKVQASAVVTNPPSACGVADANVDVTVTTGFTPYVYSWATGQVTEDLTNIVAGTYNLTITDAAGCTGNVVANVTDPSSMDVSLTTTTNPSTCGASDGAVNLVITGNSGTETYSWSNGATTASISGLPQGVYTVTITDGICVLSESYSLTEPTPVLPDAGNDTIICSGSTVTLTASLNGGSNPIWAPGGAGISINVTPLATTTYLLTVTDVNNCTATDSRIITVNDLPIVSAGSDENVCYGSDVNLTASGAINYAWTTTGTLSSSIISNPVAQDVLLTTDYIVTGTDVNGCSAVDTVTLSVNQLALTETHSDATACGLSDGFISVTTTGGFPLVSYAWSPGGEITEDISSLGLGVYTLIATDNVGCTDTLVVGVNEPASFVLSETHTNISGCVSGTTGSIDLTVTGGTNPINFNWSGPSSFTASTEDITGLTAGTYSVIVTDGTGCGSTQNITITAPTPTTVFAGSDQFICSGSTATLSATPVASGTYTWTTVSGTINTSPNTENVTVAGTTTATYYVQLTDVNGCTSIDSVIVNVANVTPLMAVTNVSTCGGADGSILVTVSGGTPPFNYVWSPSSPGSGGLNNTGLVVGNYSVTVTDAFGCSGTGNASVADPSNIVFTGSTVTSPTTCGGSDGSINVSVSGGTPVYSYAWTPSGLSGSNPTGLDSGTYVLVVTDAVNCSATQSFVVTNPSPTGPAAAGSDLYLCSGDQITLGATTTNISSFNWSTGASGNILSGATTSSPTVSPTATSTYTLITTDNINCKDTDVVSITVIIPPVISITNSVTALCSGGSATLTASGGNLYTWTPSTGLSSTNTAVVTASVTSSTNYTVSSMDTSGCVSSANTTVNAASALVISKNVTNATTCTSADGAIDITVTGGSGSYTYNWSPIFSTAQDLTSLSGNTYFLTVTDALTGCTDTISAVVTEPSSIVVSTLINHPTTCGGTGSIDNTISGGTSPYLFAWSNGSSAEDLSAVAGTYGFTVTDQTGCAYSQTFILADPIPMQVSAGADQTICPGASVNLNATGSVLYSWSPAAGLVPGSTAASPFASPSSTTNYIVTGTDLNGCVSTDTVTVFASAMLTGATTTDVTSCGLTDGSINLSVAGGNAPYAYSWSNGVITQDQVGNLGVGTYQCVITDANTCTDTIQVTISEPASFVITESHANPSTCSGNTGSITLNIPVSVVNPVVTINGITPGITTNLSAGFYNVLVSDASGCSATLGITLSDPVPTQVYAGADTFVCAGSTVNLNATNTNLVSYSWVTSDATISCTNCANPSVTPSATMDYTVIAVDANGCSSQDIVTVNPSGLNIAMSAVNTTVCATPSGSVAVTASGGTGAYTYTWNSGSNINSSSQSGVSAGSYTVVVKDEISGCTKTGVSIVNDPASFIVLTTHTNPSTCSGSDGEINAVPVPSGTYTYNWSNGAVSQNNMGLIAGTYSVTVKDQAGCALTVADSIKDPVAIKPNAGSNGIICSGSTILLNVASSGNFSSFTWTPSAGLTPSPSSASVIATPVVTTDYTVETRDSNNCVSFDTVTVTVNNLNVTYSITNNTVCGGSTGAVDVTVNGGTAPFTYTWSNGQSTEDLTNLSAGVYYDTIKDALGCMDTAIIVINDPAAFTLAITGTDPSLCNSSNGAIQVNINNQTNPVAYQINGVATALVPPFLNLAQGSYTITASDASGCSLSQTVLLTEPTPVQVTASADTSICAGLPVNISVTNAASFSSAVWSPSSTDLSCVNCFTPTVTPSSTQIYTVSAVDSKNCISTEYVSVTATGLTTAGIATNTSSCTTQDGSVSISLNGTAPYTVSWSNGENNVLFIDSLAAGVYTVTIADAMGCKDTLVGIVDEPVTYTVSTTAVDPTKCSAADGSISVAITGGTSPFTYSWSNNTNSQNATGLPQGVYLVNVTDSNNCSIIVSDTISDPLPQQVDAGIGGTICLGNSYQLEASTGFLTYSWVPSADMTPSGVINNPLITPLSSTIYTLYAKDLKDCPSEDTVSVFVNVISASASITNVSQCSGTDGSVVVSLVSGTLPVTHSWSNGATSSSIGSLASGVYIDSVSDAFGCIDTIVAIVNDPVTYTYQEVITPIASCSGKGGVTLSITGGVNPFTYVLNGNSVTMPVSNLDSGSYTLNITDGANCKANVFFSLQLPDTNFVSAGPDVNGCSGSGLSLAATSPVAGTYSWTPSTGLSSANIANPVATPAVNTIYTVQFTDAANCVYTDTVSVTLLSVYLSDTTISGTTDCFSTNGSIDITPAGGLAPYTYSWSNGETTEDVDTLTSGQYTVTLTESSTFGCATMVTLEVNSTLPLIVTAGNDTTYCTGDTIKLNGLGATTYEWFELPGNSTVGTGNSIVVSPVVGDNTYLLKGTIGFCIDYDTVLVKLVQSPAVDAGSDFDMLEGNPELVGGNPTGPSGVSYLWSPAATLSDATLANPTANPKETTVYYVVVKDTLGCASTDSVKVTVYPTIIIPEGLTPNGDGTNDTWIIDFIQKYPQAIVQVYNRWGQLLFQSAAGYPTPWDCKYNNEDLPVGTYYYIIDLKDDLVKPYTGSITIMR